MELLYLLENIRCGWLDQICLYLSMIGEEIIITTFGGILVWCIDKKWGFRLFFTSGVSQSLARLIKGTTQMPRPFERDPNFTIVEAAEKNAPGYSMPSGHCQGATNLLTTYALTIKKKPFRVLMGIVILAVMFARMELGVHTLADCIVGAGLTLAIVILYGILFEKADGRLPYLAVIAIISFAFMLTTVIILYHVPQSEFFNADVNRSCIKTGWIAFGTSLGVSIAYLIDRFWVKYDTRAPIWGQVIKVIVGVALMYGVEKLLSAALAAIMGESLLISGLRNCILLIIFLGFYPLTFRIFSKAKSKKKDCKQ